MIQDVLSVGRFGDGAAVAQDQDVRLDPFGDVVHFLDSTGRFLQRQGGRGPIVPLVVNPCGG